ncbi:MAG: hypothetical protein CXT79_02160 [Thaumarchaeota archaeon]|nr:MAG: hypothetical protein CXT79_02160 [Nitrososphaerota archaeon]
MKKTVLDTLSGIKDVYLLLFFALLAGIFQPLVSEQGTLDVIKGMGVLFLGLAGTLLVYKATISSERQGIFLITGFGLIIISLVLIYEVAGRPLL